MPDEIHERLSGNLSDKKTSSEDRQRAFFESDWTVTADGERLEGEIVSVSAAKRLIRDEITGGVSEDQPADAPIVIRAAFRFPLKSLPRSLVIKPPSNEEGSVANIGFVCYHQGLPINDFRYLSGPESLNLDWEDPWYSQFQNRNLRRQFDAPMLAYLYVEPYEVRKEIIVRPVDLQNWIDLGLGDSETIPVEAQERIKKKVAAFLLDKNPITIDGTPGIPTLDRIHFIRRTLRTTGIIEPPEPLPLNSATLGVIFHYPVESLPQEVAMQWELFTPRIQTVRAATSDEAGSLPGEITQDAPELTWVNYLRNPTAAKLRTVPSPPSKPTFPIPVVSALMLVFAVGLLGRFILGRPASLRARLPFLVASCVAAIISWACVPIMQIELPLRASQQTKLSQEDAEVIVAGLLYNVYRAFDQHNEGRIYDRLEQSIDGDLLQSIYLETRESMEVKNQGGLRVSVKEVDIENLQPSDPDADAITYLCQWRVAGSIGHWGHVHQRTNQHKAQITIAPREDRWKIIRMDSLDEKMLSEPAASASSPRGSARVRRNAADAKLRLSASVVAEPVSRRLMEDQLGTRPVR